MEYTKENHYINFCKDFSSENIVLHTKTIDDPNNVRYVDHDNNYWVGFDDIQFIHEVTNNGKKPHKVSYIFGTHTPFPPGEMHFPFEGGALSAGCFPGYKIMVEVGEILNEKKHEQK